MKQSSVANSIKKLFSRLLPGVLFFCTGSLFAEEFHAGFLYDRSPLTLGEGMRSEILGPGFYSQQKETERTWAFPVLTLAHVKDPVTEAEEFDFAYPILTYDRFGREYRWQFFQLLSFAGGQYQDGSHTRRTTVFPLYFQQRSDDPALDYTAVVPFYGHLDHRLFHDEIDFVLFPFYAKTRKKDVVTYNMPYPFFHLRYGDHLHGWQLLPFYGEEHKDLTTTTNLHGDPLTIGGHDSKFILWPFYFQATNGIGTANVSREEALIPFYSELHSPARDQISYGWPIGATHIVDHEKKFVEWDTPWPLLEFARGPGKTESRVFPFYSRGHNTNLTDNWYAWPVYKYNHVHSPPLDRERTRILFFLYDQVNLKDTESSRSFHRTGFFPFFTHRKELNGDERLQILAILETVFPNNKSIERDYSPLYSLWRQEKSPRTGASSQSLLWNLYRRETKPKSKKISLLFGLFQYQSNPGREGWRVFYIPFDHAKPPAPVYAPVK